MTSFLREQPLSATLSRLFAMAEVSLDITEEILVRSEAKDLIRYKIVCKSWNSLISSGCFIKSHLNYTLKKQADNNETGQTRIVLTGPSRSDKFQIAGSSNGLVCVRFDSQLLVVNPATHQVIEAKSLPLIFDLIKQHFPCMGFGYDSSIDDYKVVIGFRNASTDKYRFLVLTLKLNVWRSVDGELNYYHMFPNGVLCNGAIYWFAFDRINNPIIVSFNLSKEVFKEIRTPLTFNIVPTYIKLGTKKNRLCFFRSTSRNNLKLYTMKNYNVQKLKPIWEQMLLPPPCDDCPHQTKMNYIPHKSLSGHIHIWMLEKDSSAPVLVQTVISPYGNTDHIWLSTISERNYKYDEHVFVESLVSPLGMGNDNGNCDEGRVKRKMHNVISPDGDGRSVKSKRRRISVSPDRDCNGSGNGEESQTKKETELQEVAPRGIKKEEATDVVN